MKIKAIETGRFKTDGGGMYGVIPKIMWQKLTPADQNNYINVAMRSLIVEVNNRLILIDTGAGTEHSEKMQKIYQFHGDQNIYTALQENGYKPQDITDIIITHLHYDHSGGLFDQEGKAVFPNAQIHISTAHWHNANNPNPREKAAFDPLILKNIRESGKLNLIEKEGHLFDNIEILFFNGHTRGLTVPVINMQGKKIIFASDLIPTQYHIYEPYIASYDMCAEKVLEEKSFLYKRFAGENYCVFLEHDTSAECATVIKTEKGHKAESLLKLAEFTGQ